MLHLNKRRALQHPAQGLRSDIKLLELDEDMLSYILRSGVDIKGSDDDDLVLCTSDRTFALKHVSTTNTILLLPPDREGEGLSSCAAGTESAPDTSAQRDTGLQTQLAHAAQALSTAPLVVTATALEHIELAPIAPRLGSLWALLAEAPYGDADEDGSEQQQQQQRQQQQQQQQQPLSFTGGEQRQRGRRAAGQHGVAPGGGRLFSFEALLQRVAASRAELAAALQGMGAVEVDGAWRVVEAPYMAYLLRLVLLTATEQGWPVDAIPLAPLVECLTPAGFHPAIIRHCLATHGRCTGRAGAGAATDGAAALEVDADEASAGVGGVQAGAQPCYQLDATKVCVCFLRRLLAEPRRWQLGDLMAAWAAAVPPPFAPAHDMLEGEAIAECGPALPGAGAGAGPAAPGGGGGPRAWGDAARVSPLCASTLPLEPAARFAALFAARPRWEKSQMERYLRGMQVGPGMTVEALLLRHTRSSQARAGDPVVLSARA